MKFTKTNLNNTLGLSIFYDDNSKHVFFSLKETAAYFNVPYNVKHARIEMEKVFLEYLSPDLTKEEKEIINGIIDKFVIPSNGQFDFYVPADIAFGFLKNLYDEYLANIVMEATVKCIEQVRVSNIIDIF